MLVMHIKLKKLSDQSMVVFGASSGIGKLTAKKAAAAGAKVFVAARGEEGLRSLKEEIIQAGGFCEYLVADTQNFEEVKKVADKAVELFGKLDTWVHCAGVYLISPFEQTKPEEFEQIIKINLIGQAYGALAAIPHLKNSSGGALIHISSVEAKCPIPWQAAYAASKAGIVGMLDALRIELLKEKAPISVTNIMPAAINTPLFSKAKTRIGVKPNAPDPVYDPEVVADVILYASENPIREVYAGAGAFLYAFGRNNMPALMDTVMLNTIFKQQMTNESKSEMDSNNFDQPTSPNTVRGEFGDRAKKNSPLMWLALNPIIKNLAMGLGFLFLSMILNTIQNRTKFPIATLTSTRKR
jgi:NAD(P)-dependent dehydrogenase (short-subunit alcohol dehydrogenase family)